MTQKKTIAERIIHRARRSRREQFFQDLNIKVGDLVDVFHITGFLAGRTVQYKVDDLEFDKLGRRFICTKGQSGYPTRLRADGAIFGYSITKAA